MALKYIMRKYHPFHLVDASPWPIVLSGSLLTLVIGGIIFMHYNKIQILILGLLLSASSMYLWFRDIVREGTYLGYHNSYVTKGLKIGMILFIVSEICFFFSFFWAFFHSSLSPTADISFNWPPDHIVVLNIFHHPIVNTILLLFSGLTVTICHHSLVNGDREKSIDSMIATLILGSLFLLIQFIEYKSSTFCFADGIYGSTFFMLTGFHGLHVMVGTILLYISLIRLSDYQFSRHHHFGFEASVWYWHFVDVVWLFLVLCIYWWGS